MWHLKFFKRSFEMKVLAFLLMVLGGTVTFAKDSKQVVNLTVTEKGFEPNSVNVKPGETVVLNITRKTDSTCATKIQVPAKKIKADLPLNKTVSVDLGTLEKGEIRFGCGMDMMEGGKILVQ